MTKPVPAAALLLAAAAMSYSIVASAANADALSNGRNLLPLNPGIQLAMMDDMMEMKMKSGMSGGQMPTPKPDGAGSMPDSPPMAPASTEMMGRMRGPMQGRPGMGNMRPTSQLPGFPGASHLYHVGATGFFLDHPQHISLSIEQQTALNRIKEKALLNQSSGDRRIEESEQELWTLTAADAPDAAKIEAQVRAIEKLRGDLRMAFIRSVGEAGKILTADQRPALLGAVPPTGSKPNDAGKVLPMAPMAPMPQR